MAVRYGGTTWWTGSAAERSEDVRSASLGERARLQALGRLVTLSLVLWLAGCANTYVQRADGLRADAGLGAGKRVLVMELDVQLAELLASGLEQPRADWSTAARAHLRQAYVGELQRRGAQWVEFRPPEEAALVDRFRQLELLHNAVGGEALLHRLDLVRLPTKRDGFDWTLGPGVRDLKRHFGADYALFTYVRDSYATAGRKALMVLGLVAGVSVSLGHQIGYTTLIDLETGQVVWINFLVSQTGDLRTAEEAEQVARQLLTGVPL